MGGVGYQSNLVAQCRCGIPCQETTHLAKPRTIIFFGLSLLLAHGIVLTLLGTVAPGPYLSDLIQFFLGGVLVVSCFRAARVSDGLPRHFWQLAALAFSIWLVAQGIATYGDLLPVSEFSLWAENLLFCFWFVPLAMALFLASTGSWCSTSCKRSYFVWLPTCISFTYHDRSLPRSWHIRCGLLISWATV